MNSKMAWKDAGAIGLGLREEDCERSINGIADPSYPLLQTAAATPSSDSV